MKNFAFILFVSLLFTNRSSAQINRERNGVSLGIGFVLNDFETVNAVSKNTYSTSRSRNTLRLDRMVPGISMTLQSGFSSHFDWTFTISGSFTDSALKQQVKYSEKHLFLEIDASVKANILSAGKRFQPYAQAGAGFTYYNQYTGIFVPIGLGLQAKIVNDVFGNINFQYRHPISAVAGHFYYSVGIYSALNRGKRKPVTRNANVESTGIAVRALDTDKDGIVDCLDSCPTLPGIKRFNGCPDGDQDEIPDHDDACPNVFGKKEFGGCPPPDRDGDGLTDDIDDCPDVSGFQTRNGCPFVDRDSDGLEDDKDNCPDMAGLIGNKGCPAIDSAIIRAVEQAAKHIHFRSGSYEINTSSFAYLDQISNTLLKNPGMRLKIEGHTDNVGSITSNQKLSEDRALAVLVYLQNKGVRAGRLQSNGFGQTKPVETNNTSKGREANRRVELYVSYQ
jgi:OmpA-OmpF porin, OOP family